MRRAGIHERRALGGSVLLPPGTPLASASSFTPQQLVTAGLLQFWFDADSGLTNLGAFGAGGDLLNDTGGCAITAGAINGHSTYSPLKASGGWLRTAVLSFPNGSGIQTPFHYLVVGRMGAASAGGDSMLGGQNRLAFNISTKMQFGAVTGPAVADVTQFCIHEIFDHNVGSRFGTNGTYQTSTLGSTVPLLNGGRLVIGADAAGANRGTCDVACVMVCDNRIPYADYINLITYLNNRYALSTTADAIWTQPEEDTVAAPALWTPSNPWDAIPFLGQSNADAYGSVDATAPWGANTYVFSNQCTWLAGSAANWSSATNHKDTVNLDVAGTLFGWAGSLAALEQARHSGKPTCVITCAHTNVSAAQWSATIGGKKRGFLYGSALWRIKKALDHGATIPYVIVHQGEFEANATQGERDAWAATWVATITQLRADLLAAFPVKTYLGTLPVLFALVRNDTMSASYPEMHDTKIPAITGLLSNCATFDVPIAGPFNADHVHLQGVGLDGVAANAQAAAIANGWS